MTTERRPLHQQGLMEGRRPDGTAIYVPLVLPAPACPVPGCPGPDTSHDGAAIGCGLDRNSEDCEA